MVPNEKPPLLVRTICFIFVSIVHVHIVRLESIFEGQIAEFFIPNCLSRFATNDMAVVSRERAHFMQRQMPHEYLSMFAWAQVRVSRPFQSDPPRSILAECASATCPIFSSVSSSSTVAYTVDESTGGYWSFSGNCAHRSHFYYPPPLSLLDNELNIGTQRICLSLPLAIS